MVEIYALVYPRSDYILVTFVPNFWYLKTIITYSLKITCQILIQFYTVTYLT